MKLTQNNTPEKRTERVNFVLTPTIKAGITKIAAIKQISLNDLANTTFQELVSKYESKIKEYDAFIAKMNPEPSRRFSSSVIIKDHL